MAEAGVKIVELEDGTILRVPPGTDTGDLKVVSDEPAGSPEETEPQPVTTETAVQEPAPEPEPEKEENSSPKASKKK